MPRSLITLSLIVLLIEVEDVKETDGATEEALTLTQQLCHQ